MICQRCDGDMKPSKALLETCVIGILDFPGSDDMRGQTMSAGGPGKLVDCLKCCKCGYSVMVITQPSSAGDNP